MCSNPILIKNTYFNSSVAHRYAVDTSCYIRVPCGKCQECIGAKQQSIVQRTQMTSLKYHLFFCTLTYNNDMIPRLTTSTGYEYMYCDWHDLQNMFKLIRKYNDFGRSWKYLAVSERGTKKGRPHFHILFAVEKFENDQWFDVLNLQDLLYSAVKSRWCRNVGTNRNPIYKPCFTFKQKVINRRVNCNYDLHYVSSNSSNDGCTSVAFYVSKYMLKVDKHADKMQQALRLNLPDDEYRSTWKLIKSRMTKSHNWGLADDNDISEYLRSCVDLSRSSSDYLAWFDPFNGNKFAMSPYYKKRFLSLSDKLLFADRKGCLIDGECISIQEPYSEYEHNLHARKLEKFNNIVFSKPDALDIFADSEF